MQRKNSVLMISCCEIFYCVLQGIGEKVHRIEKKCVSDTDSWENKVKFVKLFCLIEKKNVFCTTDIFASKRFIIKGNVLIYWYIYLQFTLSVQLIHVLLFIVGVFELLSWLLCSFFFQIILSGIMYCQVWYCECNVIVILKLLYKFHTIRLL